MVYKLFFLLSAVGVAVLALALVTVATMGLLVWLSGTGWARRPD